MEKHYAYKRKNMYSITVFLMIRVPDACFFYKHNVYKHTEAQIIKN